MKPRSRKKIQEEPIQEGSVKDDIPKEDEPIERPQSLPMSKTSNPSDPSKSKSPVNDKKKKPVEKQEVLIPVPYACKSINRQIKRDAYDFIKKTIEKLGEGQDDAIKEKLKKVERRLKTFVHEFNSKVDEVVIFEKIYEKKTTEKTDDLDEDLIKKNNEAMSKLTELIHRIKERNSSLEISFFKELSKEVDESFLHPTKIIDSDLRLRSRHSQMPFDEFIDRYIKSQKEYMQAIIGTAELLNHGFDNIKNISMQRFKLALDEHSKLESIIKAGFIEKTEAEMLLF